MHVQVVGITGGLASGKSTVASLLHSREWQVVDADQLAHTCLHLCREKIRDYFGESVFDPNGEINRLTLAERVFANAKDLSVLEALLHPCVKKRMIEVYHQAKAQQENRMAFEVPLLFEKNWEMAFDAIIFVTCSESLQEKRYVQRGGSDFARRQACQIRLSEKKKRAKWHSHITIIENDGTQIELEEKVTVWASKLEAQGMVAPSCFEGFG